MSNDKMREEFSAWYLAEVTESYGKGCRAQAEKNLEWVFEDGRFAEPMLRLGLQAWQASREALVIELPPEPSVPEEPEEAIDDSHMDAYHAAKRMRAECVKSVKAAGVKVKP
jgi:hypothetical protein